jgi:hypothetical protein
MPKHAPPPASITTFAIIEVPDLHPPGTSVTGLRLDGPIEWTTQPWQGGSSEGKHP